MQADVMNTFVTQAVVSAVGQTNTVPPQIRLVPYAYSAAWKSFCRRCGPKQVDPLYASLGMVCDFLTDQFETES